VCQTRRILAPEFIDISTIDGSDALGADPLASRTETTAPFDRMAARRAKTPYATMHVPRVHRYLRATGLLEYRAEAAAAGWGANGVGSGPDVRLWIDGDALNGLGPGTEDPMARSSRVCNHVDSRLGLLPSRMKRTYGDAEGSSRVVLARSRMVLAYRPGETHAVKCGQGEWLR
jgi:hypothetical protein